jgi:DNA-directed RNA polymerase specialized sigma24 family protein
MQNRVGIAVTSLGDLSRGESCASPAQDDPETAARAAQASALLASVRRGLTSRQATIIWLHHYEGRSLADIAITVEMSHEAVRAMHVRTLRALRDELALLGIHQSSDVL